MITVEDLLGAFGLAYDTWLDPEVERENPIPEYASLIRKVVSAENAELRKLVALQMVIGKHMSLCATTDCGQCSVREECEESVYLEGLLGIDPKELSWRVQKRMAETTDIQAENANLRELARQMYPYAKAYLQLGVTLGCNDTLSYDWELQMTELGIVAE